LIAVPKMEYLLITNIFLFTPASQVARSSEEESGIPRNTKIQIRILAEIG
jgi:hypothetical protein